MRAMLEWRSGVGALRFKHEPGTTYQSPLTPIFTL